MIKKLFLYLILLCVIHVAVGQRYTPSLNQLEIHGQNIPLNTNVKKQLKTLKAEVERGSRLGSDHYIVKFDKIPSISEQSALSDRGLVLMDYLSNGAYYAKVDIGKISSNPEEVGISSIIDIKPEYKISAPIAKGDIPTHAKEGKDWIKVILTFFKGTENDAIEESLISLNTKDFKIDQNFNQISATIYKGNISQLASLKWVESIDLVDAPMNLENFEGRNLHRANVLNSIIPGLGFGLTGKGVTVGLWDADVVNHRDFNGRVENKEFEMHNTDHGTHTCGTIAGAGLIDPKTRGMAPESKIVAWNFNVQSNGLNNAQERLLSLQNDGIELTSNSFGVNVTSCPNQTKYGTSDKNEDLLANMFPYFLFVYSAGNNQSVCTGGFNTTSKNMKNSLMVAAIDRTDKMSTFSSFGPSYDGRLIPNISGDGVDVYSTFFDNGYGYMSGTSMATPGVAGTMALIYQRYKETHGGEKPISSLMRALACNTAKDLGNPGPDYKFGYGEINGVRAVRVMDKKQFVVDKAVQDDHKEITIDVPFGAVELKVMLAWTDVQGTPGSKYILVNDLDLSITHNGDIKLPWVLDPKNPSANATRDYDGMNNMEQVTIANPMAGKYTINVDAYAIPNGVQEYSIVYDFVMPSLNLTYPIGGEAWNPGDEEVLHWDSEGLDQTFTIEYSKDGGINYDIIASGIPSELRSYAWKVPSDITSKAKFRISNGTTFDESKGEIAIMNTPQNVYIAPSACNSSGPFTMEWDNIDNAKYEVLKLHGQVYEHLADVSTNSYDVNNLSPNNDNYFSVRAIDITTGAISERSLAVTVNPTIAESTLSFNEDFETQKAPDFNFSSEYGSASVRYANDAQKYSIRLEGSTNSTSWVTSTSANCFTNNPNFIANASICNLNTSAYTGKKLRLKFDYRQKFKTAAGTSYFRVKVNGTTLKNAQGLDVYGDSKTINYKTVEYDLSAYTGQPSIKIEFEAVCKTNYVIYVNSSGNYDFSDDSFDSGDFVNIDNVQIFEPKSDVALTDVVAGTGLTNSESISIKIRNNSGEPVSNIPVSFQIGDGNILSEQIAGPVAALEEVTYTFLQKADFSVPGKYDVTVSANWNKDTDHSNDKLTTQVFNDNSIKLGVAVSPYATCSGVFTDYNGKFQDYSANQSYTLTVKPDMAGKRSKITFTEFDTEEGYDYFYIYNGPNTSSPLLGKFSGNSLPPSFTSTASGGELTFKFVSDTDVNGAGWVSNLECVDLPSVDVAATAILKPTTSGVFSSVEQVQATFANMGSGDLSNIAVHYQIDAGPITSETITTLSAGQSVNYTFTTTTDLSTPATYSLRVWADAIGDANESNNSVTASILNKGLIYDASVTSISTIAPHRVSTSPISASIKNNSTIAISGFDVAYRINDGAEVVESYTSTIAAGASANYTFTTKADLTTANTSYKIDVYTKLPNDASSVNDLTSVTIVTPPTEATNQYGSFTSASSYMIANATPAINLTNNYSIECWVNLKEPTAYGHIFNKTNVSLWYETSYGSSFYGSNSYILSVTKASSNFTFYVPNSVVLNKWQHLALTVSSSNEYTLYIDGVAQVFSISSGTAGPTKTNSSNPLAFGNRPTDLVRPINGSIDEARVWSKCLSPTEVVNNSMSNFVGTETGLIAYYKFIEGNGKYVYDYSNNDNTAIVYNADVDGKGQGKFWNDDWNLLETVNFPNETLPTTFDKGTKTFYATMPTGTDLTSLIADFSTSQKSTVKVGSTIQTSGVTANDFTNTLDYTVDGVGFNSGISQTYHIAVAIEKSSLCELTAYSFETANNPNLTSSITLIKNGNNFHQKLPSETNLSNLIASFNISPLSTLYINGVAQSSPQINAVDYTKPILLTVVAENGRTMKNYSITLDTRIGDADLKKFEIADLQIGESKIDRSLHTVEVNVKKDADLTYITPIFTLSPKASLLKGSVYQMSGISSDDYSKPTQLRVISEDESTHTDWTVTLIKDETKPVITLLGASSMTVEIGSVYADAGATATDNVSGDISTKIVSNSNTVNTAQLGTYIVNYNVKDESGNSADQVSRTVVVIKKDQTIAFDDASRTYGDEDFSPAKASSELPVSYRSDNTSVAEIVAGKIHIKGAGTAIITASQTGNGSYNPAQSISKAITIKKAILKVSSQNASKVYGEPNPTFKSIITGFVSNEDVSVVSGTAALSTDAWEATPAGNYKIVVKLGSLSASNYDFAFEYGNLSIAKAPLTITIDNKTREQGMINPDFTYVVDGLKNGESILGAVKGIALGTTADESSQPGDYPINQAGTPTSTNYTCTFINGTLHIVKAMLEQTIQFNNVSKTYGDADFSPATSTSGLKISYTSDNPSVADVVAGKIHIKGTGAAIITASQAGDGTYNPAESVSKVITIKRAVLTVVPQNANRVYGDHNPVFSSSVIGFVYNEDASVVDGVAELSSDAVENSPAGNYKIVSKRGTLSAINYDFVFELGTLTISKAPLKVVIDDKTRKHGTTNPTFTYSVDGLKNGENFLSAVKGFTFSSNANETSTSGDYPIKQTGTPTSTNYEATFVDGKLTVVNMIQASGIDFTNISKDQISFSLIKGDGANRIAFVGLEAASETLTPVSGIAYTANSTYGKGSQLRGNWYCAYNGTGDQVTISGLKDGVVYKVVVYEYNGTAALPVYNTTIVANSNIKTAPTCLLPSGGEINLDRKLCQNSSALISVTGVVKSDSYQWILPNGITGSSNSETISVSISPDVNGKLSISVTPQNTCGLGSTIKKDVNIYAVDSIKLVEKWNDVLICPNVGSKYTNFQWYKDGQPISGATEQYYTTHKAPGSYAVKVNDANACLVSSNVKVMKAASKISIFPNPVQSHFVLQLSGEELGQTVIRVSDYSGKMIINTAVNKSLPVQNVEIDASNIVHGTYTIEVVVDSNVKHTAILVKE